MVMNLANRILSEFGAFVFFIVPPVFLLACSNPKKQQQKHISKQTNKKQGGKRGMSIRVDFCISVHGEYYLQKKEK